MCPCSVAALDNGSNAAVIDVLRLAVRESCAQCADDVVRPVGRFKCRIVIRDFADHQMQVGMRPIKFAGLLLVPDKRPDHFAPVQQLPGYVSPDAGR